MWTGTKSRRSNQAKTSLHKLSPDRDGVFDAHIVVDWSASNTAKRGKDSIWIGETRRNKNGLETTPPVNPATRSEAMEQVQTMLENAISAGRRTFIGFDFPFGYPAGTTKILSGKANWQNLWHSFAAEVEDADDNRSNRYQLAGRWNAEKFNEPVFWGRPHQHDYENLPAKKPTSGLLKTYEFRIVERWQRPAKSLWQLAYNGAVGSQAILGIARLEHLRKALGDNARIWPFETMWDRHLDAPVTIAEVYPSMINPEILDGDVKDAAQVRGLALTFARLDRNGLFKKYLSRPDGLSESESTAIITEEGWITGTGHSIG